MLKEKDAFTIPMVVDRAENISSTALMSTVAGLGRKARGWELAEESLCVSSDTGRNGWQEDSGIPYQIMTTTTGCKCHSQYYKVM